MRDRSVRCGQKVYSFTNEHFDTLCKHLVAYLERQTGKSTLIIDSGERTRPAAKAPKRSRPTKKSGRTDDTSEAPMEVVTATDSNWESHSPQGTIVPGSEATIVDASSSPVKKRKLRKKKKRKNVEPYPDKASASKEPRVSKPSTVVAPPPLDEKEYRDRVVPRPFREGDSDSASTLSSLADKDASFTTRLKRAVLRYLLAGRECSCSLYGKAIRDYNCEDIRSLVDKFVGSLPALHELQEIGKTVFFTGVLAQARNYIPCPTCAISVGTGVSHFVWIVYSEGDKASTPFVSPP